MKERIVVIGLGRLGTSLVENLSQQDVEVVAVDQDMGRINKVKNEISHCIQGDSTDIEFLKQIGVEKADRVILCMGEDLESSILTVTLLLELAVKKIHARAANTRNAKILGRVGAHEVFFVENEMGKILANRFTKPSVLKEMELGYGLKIADWYAAPWTHEKTLAELAFPTKFGVQVVALFDAKDPDQVIFPTSQSLVHSGSRCLLVGTEHALNKITSQV